MRIADNIITRLVLFITIYLLFFPLLFSLKVERPKKVLNIDKNIAFQNLKIQTDLGPRIPGSIAHAKTRQFIQNQLIDHGWTVEAHHNHFNQKSIYNILAHLNNMDNYVLIGAHYDSRIYADRDPDVSKRSQPVPGANDGASGVAVLLELARVISSNQFYCSRNINLIFFDAEDNGNIDNWDWIMGSHVFADNLTVYPEYVIILDMIGDKDLDIYYEKHSSEKIREEIWEIGASLGYHDVFIPIEKYSIIDDHIPFINLGIEAVVIIDFDYPYWHTTLDTIDKVSADSLEKVGNTVLAWLCK